PDLHCRRGQPSVLSHSLPALRITQVQKSLRFFAPSRLCAERVRRIHRKDAKTRRITKKILVAALIGRDYRLASGPSALTSRFKSEARSLGQTSTLPAAWTTARFETPKVAINPASE